MREISDKSISDTDRLQIEETPNILDLADPVTDYSLILKPEQFDVRLKFEDVKTVEMQQLNLF
jgi:hypothetical protein